MKIFSWILRLFLGILLSSPSSWSRSSEWYLSVQPKKSTPPEASTLAHVRFTDENLLVITSLSPEAPLAGRLAFNTCHYPVDLKPFTDHLMIKTDQFIKKTLNPAVTLKKYEWLNGIELNPENVANFSGALATFLNDSGLNQLIIEDPHHSTHCQDVQDDAILALSNAKIHPRNIFLILPESGKRISLYDWTWEKIEEQWRESELKNGNYEPHRKLQQFIDWIEKLRLYEPPCNSVRTESTEVLRIRLAIQDQASSE